MIYPSLDELIDKVDSRYALGSSSCQEGETTS